VEVVEHLVLKVVECSLLPAMGLFTILMELVVISQQ